MNHQKQPTSAKKLDANRKNYQKSTGPRTAAGKAKASLNSYKHGLFCKRLFLDHERAPKDKEDYLDFAKGLHDHYQPVGFLENFLVEKIATEALRAARLLTHEQKMLIWNSPFESHGPNNLQRYLASINRESARAMDKLEELQALRKAEEMKETEAEGEAQAEGEAEAEAEPYPDLQDQGEGGKAADSAKPNAEPTVTP
jgi:hypothetical protein